MPRMKNKEAAMIDPMIAYVILQQTEFGRRERRRHAWTIEDRDLPEQPSRFRRWRLRRASRAG
jgi:hypothetical protein